MRAAKKKLAPLAAAKAALVDPSKKAKTTSLRAQFNNLFQKKSSGLSKDEGTLILRSLATLCGNGVSLPRAIGAIADEKGLDKHRPLLLMLRKKIEAGDTFSHALSVLHGSFDKITLSQIRVGERAGNLSDTLSQIADQREKSGKIREEIIKKLSYPAVLLLVGIGVVSFLLGFVVPVFEETYRSANVPLPGITRVLIQVGALAQGYWWVLPIVGGISTFTIRQLRGNEQTAKRMDQWLLTLPLAGPWIRDVSLLQMMEAIGCLLEAGFTLADALEEAAASVGNRAMKAGVVDLHHAVMRGEKFSRQVEKHSELFPPMVSQLIIVGEQTGRLTKSTRDIHVLLEEEVKRRAEIAVGVIEPVITMSMACAVGVILLAIYLPMFDMISTVG